MDTILKEALTPANVPSDRMNDAVLRQIKERSDMSRLKTYHTRKIAAAGIITACTLTFGTITAAAAYHYLSTSEVAKEVNDTKLEQAFLSKDALSVNETQEYGGYRITLLGSVSGKNISQYLREDDNGNISQDCIYTAVAIARTDGTPMPDTSSDDYGKDPFYVSHYICGLNPSSYSLMSMGGGYSEFVKDGVLYRLLEMDNIEMFADKGIYVGVSSGTFYDNDAYRYNETTGEITRNKNYEGVNALFVLPLDKSKADPKAAEKYLKELEESSQNDSAEDRTDPNETEEDRKNQASIEEFMAKITPDTIDQYAEPIESTRKVCVPDADGTFSYSYELENGAAGNSTSSIEYAIADTRAGVCNIEGYSSSDNGLEDLLIQTYTMNEDGTITGVLYRPKKEAIH